MLRDDHSQTVSSRLQSSSGFMLFEIKFQKRASTRSVAVLFPNQCWHLQISDAWHVPTLTMPETASVIPPTGKSYTILRDIQHNLAVAAGINPMDIKRGIDKGVVAAVEELAKISTPCTDTKAIAQVGTISANSDSAVGDIIAEAMDKVGKEGVITVEEGSGLDNELDVVEGMQFDRGYLLSLIHI